MKRIVLDIETNSTASHIWLAVTQDLDTKEIKVWKEATDGLNQYLRDADTIVMQNGIQFDAPVLNRLWKTQIRLSQIHDTLILSRLLNPIRENGHSLDSWGEKLGLNKIDYASIWSWMTGKFYDEKNYAGQPFDEPHMGLLEYYCIRDVELTGKLYDYLIKEQETTKTSAEAFQLEMQTQSIIAVQERNGFKLDIPYAMSLLSTIKGEMDEIVSKMREVFPDIVHKRVSEKTGKALQDRVEIFNVGSRQQIAARLMGLGWKPTKRTEKGSIIVDEAVLEGVNIPEAKFIARYLMLQKRVGQLENWLDNVKEDGRIHGKVITIGAVTGRMSHSNPNVAQTTSARAEYGKEMRSCWIVDKGNKLVGVDLSGIELRLFAHYLNDPDYADEVVNGDAHTRNQQAFGCATRDQAKTLLYAMLYSAGPAKIGAIVGGTDKDGKKIINNFMKAVPAYARLKEKVERLASSGTLPRLDGGRLQVRSEHSALNTLLQGAAAVVFKKWLVITRNELTKAKIPYKLVATVHDEQEFEVAETYAEQLGKTVVDSAVQAGVELGIRCPIAAECKIGENWYQVH